MVNMQKDGIYFVVLCVFGGEIIFDGLIVIGEIGKKYDFYIKIIGGQCIDLFGVQVYELLLIWKELIDVGFESGYVYGKFMCIVKSCVGFIWCCYGVQDSVGMVIEIEK